MLKGISSQYDYGRTAHLKNGTLKNCWCVPTQSLCQRQRFRWTNDWRTLYGAWGHSRFGPIMFLSLWVNTWDNWLAHFAKVPPRGTTRELSKPMRKINNERGLQRLCDLLSHKWKPDSRQKAEPEWAADALIIPAFSFLTVHLYCFVTLQVKQVLTTHPPSVSPSPSPLCHAVSPHPPLFTSSCAPLTPLHLHLLLFCLLPQLVYTRQTFYPMWPLGLSTWRPFSPALLFLSPRFSSLSLTLLSHSLPPLASLIHSAMVFLLDFIAKAQHAIRSIVLSLSLSLFLSRSLSLSQVVL